MKQNYSKGVTFYPMEATISSNEQVTMNNIRLSQFLISKDGLSAEFNVEQELASAWIFGLL